MPNTLLFLYVEINPLIRFLSKQINVNDLHYKLLCHGCVVFVKAGPILNASPPLLVFHR